MPSPDASAQQIVSPGGIAVPDDSLTWRFSRSSAPGGQHVNTSSTKVDLRCDIARLDVDDQVRARLVERLGPTVRVVVSSERSQLRNRHEALRRVLAALDEAARPDVARRATRPTRSSVRERLDTKRRQSQRKQSRRWSPDD